MKRVAALGALLILAGAGCGGSAGGRGVLFVRFRPDVSRIYLLRPHTAVPVPLGPAGDFINSVAWSPDGESIAYAAQQGPWDQANSFGIYEMSADGGGSHEIISGDGALFGAVGPVWSPSGDEILYDRVFAMSEAAFLHSVPTGQERRERTDSAAAVWGRGGIRHVRPGPAGVAWLRGGGVAVLTADERTVVVYSPNGRPRRRVPLPGPGKGCAVSSSANGRTLLVAVSTSPQLGSNRAVLWTTGLSGKRWRRLPIAGGTSCAVSWR